MKSHTKPLAALLVVLALIATACGGGTSDDPDDTGSVSSTSPSTDQGEKVQASTLEEFFGWNQEYDPSADQERQRQIEEAVAACMAGLGWEYRPVDYGSAEYEYFDPFQDVGEAEWAAQWGFGATTFILDDPWRDIEYPESEFQDPNQAYVESLSDIEREQYYEDLYGTYDEPAIDPETGEYTEEEIHFDAGNGCYNQASAEIYGIPDEGSQQDFSEIWEEFERLEQEISADPRMIEADEQWASCMSDKGFTYQTPSEAQEQFYMEAERFWMAMEQAYTDPFEGWTEDEINLWFENTPQEEQEDFFDQFNQGPQFDEATTAEIRAISEEEIKTAVAAYECSEGLKDIHADIRAEYESAFIQENLEMLNDYKEATGF
ncbi:MAG: hypothetical protein HKO10_04435 [Acidimicrobiia bacterium]|nr:hypothetical protein [Acidimicrobiia bacterium]